MEFVINTTENIPHYDQYFGLWSMNEPEFRGLAERASSFDVRLHLQQQREMPKRPAATLDVRKNGVAVIELAGTLMKHVSSFTNGTSTVEARRLVTTASRSKEVKAILLHIDSPGGTAAGTEMLANAVAAAKKPVYAFIEDMGASAAYWIASQADKVFTNASGLVGSIGTFMVVHDLSAMASREGIKVHVIKAGTFKGAGVPGTEITADILQDEQRVVDQLNDQFIAAVSRGRQKTEEQVREIADGRVHVGEHAQALGFVDGIKTFDQTFNSLVRRVNMAATYQEIATALPKANETFICDCLKTERTVDQAREDWTAHLELQLEEREAELQRAIERADAESTARTEAEEKVLQHVADEATAGVDPLPEPAPNAEAVDPDPTVEWERLIREKMNLGIAKPKAVAQVAKENPDLRQAFLESHQAKRRRA